MSWLRPLIVRNDYKNINKMKAKHLKLTIVALSCTLSACLSAQTIQKPGQYKIGQHLYTVSKIGDGSHLLIEEGSRIISRIQQNPRNLTRLNDINFSGQKTTIGAFVKVLGKQRIKELLHEKYLIIDLYPVATGNVEAIRYNLNSHTKLTFKEIDRLTTYIKKNITFQIPPEIGDGAKIWPINQVIKFSSLLN